MKNLIKLINFVETAILLVGMPLMVILVFTGVVFRYFALGSMSWGEEAARYVMIWVVFAGISYAFRFRAHLGLSFFMDLLPAGLKRVATQFKRLIILAFGGITAFLCWLIVQTQYATNQLSPSMGVPLWLVYFALLFGMTMIVVRTLIEFFSATKFENS